MKEKRWVFLPHNCLDNRLPSQWSVRGWFTYHHCGSTTMRFILYSVRSKWKSLWKAFSPFELPENIPSAHAKTQNSAVKPHSHPLCVTKLDICASHVLVQAYFYCYFYWPLSETLLFHFVFFFHLPLLANYDHARLQTALRFALVPPSCWCASVILYAYASSYNPWIMYKCSFVLQNDLYHCTICVYS